MELLARLYHNRCEMCLYAVMVVSLYLLMQMKKPTSYLIFKSIWLIFLLCWPILLWEGDDSLVLSMETFEHLGFLLHFLEGTSLSQNISSSLEFYTEKSTAKGKGASRWLLISMLTWLMPIQVIQGTTHLAVNPAFRRNCIFVEGFKSSVVKHASDVNQRAFF